MWLKDAWSWASNLVGNNPKARVGIFAFAFLFLFLAARCAIANELHVEAGVSAIHGTGPYLGIYYTLGESKTVHLETMAQLWGSTSPYEGRSIDSNWAPSVMLDVSKGPLTAGLGFAYLVKPDRLDGSNLNFSLKLRYELDRRFGIVIRHLSNAGTVAPNIGRNALAVDIRLQ